MFREKQVKNLLKTENQTDLSQISFPRVQCVFPSMITNQIVSVQPMTAIGAGRIFYMDNLYGSVVWKKLRRAGLKRK